MSTLYFTPHCIPYLIAAAFINTNACIHNVLDIPISAPLQIRATQLLFFPLQAQLFRHGRSTLWILTCVVHVDRLISLVRPTVCLSLRVQSDIEYA